LSYRISIDNIGEFSIIIRFVAPQQPGDYNFKRETASTECAMLDHVTLRTRDLEGTKAFFETVLGLEAGYRPAFPFAGYWLYAAGQPIVHLIPGPGGPVDRSGETIDHVAFRLDDHEAMRQKLDRLSIPYSQMNLPELGERRLFIRTPTGVLLELVFRATEAEFVTSTSQERSHAE
ncbi:VOC family protein, partial [Roseiarcus sp.]|uniref:VOC family protein n=1 Tax=Roseiarcus sp. TaxID=1969460 RepID=UPI003F95593B